jgi:hypothetical protein
MGCYPAISILRKEAMLSLLSTLERQIIRVIGHSKGASLWGELPLSTLTESLRYESVSSDHLQPALSSLISKGILSEDHDEEPDISYTLTQRGYRVLSAMENAAGLTMHYDSVAIATVLSDIPRKEIDFVEEFFAAWNGNFVHVLRQTFRRCNLTDCSLYLCYVASQSASFDWLAHMLLSGAYDAVMRELRSKLEGMFVAHNLDIEYPGKSLKEKLEAMAELEQQGKGHGKFIFRSSGVENWEEYYEVFRRLCRYVHISSEVVGIKIREVASSGFPELIEPYFDKDAFVQCVKEWREVANVSLILADNLCDLFRIEDHGFDVTSWQWIA